MAVCDQNSIFGEMGNKGLLDMDRLYSTDTNTLQEMQSVAGFALRLLCDDGRRVGFISCWQWPDLAYVEHFAVDPAVRGGGYGAAALQRLCAEACTPVVLEVEKPHDEMSRRRIGFYRRCGFVLSERPYVQPPYSEGARPLPLHLMFFAAPSAGSDVVPDSFFCEVRDRLHRDVYRVEVGRYV